MEAEPIRDAAGRVFYRRTPEGWEHLPADLRPLGRLQINLPSPPGRFRSGPGQLFLRELDTVRKSGVYSAGQLAAHLGVSVQTIRNWMNQRLRDIPPWPTDSDLRTLRAALRVADTCKRLRRRDPQFAAVHLALHDLLTQGFELADLARVAGVAQRRMRWFAEPPLASAAELARRLEHETPRHRPRQGA